MFKKCDKSDKLRINLLLKVVMVFHFIGVMNVM